MTYTRVRWDGSQWTVTITEGATTREVGPDHMMEGEAVALARRLAGPHRLVEVEPRGGGSPGRMMGVG